MNTTQERPEVCLADVADLVRGVTYPKAEARDQPAPGYVPMLRATNIQDAKLVLNADLIHIAERNVSNEQRLRPGDIVVATSSGSKHLVGKSALLRSAWAGAFGAFCAAIRPKPNVEPRFLAAFLQSPSYWKQVGKKALGVNINNLRRGDIETLTLPLPNLDEQHRIVADIEKQFSRLDEAVAGLKRVKANLKRYKAAILKAAVEGRLVPTEADLARREGRNYETGTQLLQRILDTRRSQWQGKGKYKEPAAPDTTTGLPELPEGWAWASIAQISSLVTDGDHNPPKRTAIGIRHLTAKHVRNWRLDPTDCTYISSDDADRVFKRYNPQSADLIVTCVGTIGRTAIVPEGFAFSPDRNLAAIRLSAESPSPKYVQLVLESPDRQKFMRGVSGSTAQPHLYLGDLRAILIPLPPLAEQHRIVAEVDRLLSIAHEAEAEIETNLKRAHGLRHAILQREFDLR